MHHALHLSPSRIARLRRSRTARFWLSAALGLIVVGCQSGPARLDQTVRPDEWQTYTNYVTKRDGDQAEAWLAWRAEETGRSADELRKADEALREDANPFETTDPWAVRRGALVFRAACVECHGPLADGIGPDGGALMGIKDFSDPQMRMALAMDSGRLAKWYPKVADGSSSGRIMPDGRPADMPAMRERLTRAQIWLALTWLGSDAGMAEGSQP